MTPDTSAANLASAPPAPKAPTPPRRALAMIGAFCLFVLAAIAMDTTVVHIGSDEDVREMEFEPDRFGLAQFPRIQGNVEERAVGAVELADALAADKDAAIEEFGTPSSTGAIIPVRLTGVAGDSRSGIYNVVVEGLSEDIRVRVQTGPAINGMDLRDAPGDIAFGDFTNQIEFQDAGSGINRAMKASILDVLADEDLTGRTINVVGVFRIINPRNWLITPVRIDAP